MDFRRVGHEGKTVVKEKTKEMIGRTIAILIFAALIAMIGILVLNALSVLGAISGKILEIGF